MALRWIIAGGGTGGHVTLALALGEVVASKGHEILFIGSDAGRETQAVPEAGFELVTLQSRQVMGRGLAGRISGATGISLATLRALRELRRFGADFVISVGGYAALPAAFAASLTRTPLALVEPNSVPGRANRLTARFAARVFTGFESAATQIAAQLPPRNRDRIRCLGVPLRRELVREFESSAPRGVPSAPFHLLVFGGSQGARQINDAMVEAAPLLSGLPLEIFHQAGESDGPDVATAYREAGISAQVVEFEPDMPSRYRWADLAISRAGALSVAELALARLPALLVPYPWAADDHQTGNARELEASGAARRLEADATHRLKGACVADALRPLLAEPHRLADMSQAAAKLGRPRAAEEIIDDCLQLLE